MKKSTSILALGAIVLLLSGCESLTGEERPDSVQGIILDSYVEGEPPDESYILMLDLNGDGEADRLADVPKDTWENAKVGDTFKRYTVRGE